MLQFFEVDLLTTSDSLGNRHLQRGALHGSVTGCPCTILQGLRTAPPLEGAGIIAGMCGVPFSCYGQKLYKYSN